MWAKVALGVRPSPHRGEGWWASLTGRPEAGPGVLAGAGCRLPGPAAAALLVCRSRGVRLGAYRAGAVHPAGRRSSSVSRTPPATGFSSVVSAGGANLSGG